MKALIGEIWLITIPVLTYDKDNNININLQKRPCLIVDDGRGLIVEQDKRNYHVLKLTTQYDRYKRKLLKNWKKYGLIKKSYIRIEMPIKIENQQLVRKITSISKQELLEMYNEIYKIINIHALKKISKKYEGIRRLLKKYTKITVNYISSLFILV